MNKHHHRRTHGANKTKLSRFTVKNIIYINKNKVYISQGTRSDILLLFKKDI